MMTASGDGLLVVPEEEDCFLISLDWIFLIVLLTTTRDVRIFIYWASSGLRN
jgi:hypothetical protein